MRGCLSINTVVTSKEAILNVSRELVTTRGWAALNIRTVAAACGVSVGSIYNYFSSKSDLVAAAVESVWHDILCFPENDSGFDSFTSCIQWIFDSMKTGYEKYPGFFTAHSMSFLGEDKESGRQLMEQTWKRIQDGLYMVLMNDKNVRPQVFDEIFTPEKFVIIIFSLIISALARQDYDCGGILGMISRIIY